MEPLHKDDIDILDNLVIELFNKGELELGNEYKRFLAILKEWDVINFNLSGSTQDGIFLHSNGVITERFINEGCFKKKFQEQIENAKNEKLLKKGNIVNATNSILTNKTFWWTFGIVIAGFIIALLQYIK